MPTALVFVGKQNTFSIAKRIAEGVTVAGAVAIMTKNIQDADLYFLDAQNIPHYDFANKKVALYVLGKSAVKKLDEARNQLDTAEIVDTISLRSQGLPMFEKPRDEELIRAKGFGEKVTHRALRQRVGSSHDKRKIKGYVK